MSNYFEKYQKYKIKYLQLKNKPMIGGRYNCEPKSKKLCKKIKSSIKVAKKIVKKNLKYFQDLHELNYEVAGIFRTKDKTFEKTAEGTPKKQIVIYDHYPFNNDIINFHTHSSSVKPQIVFPPDFPKDEQRKFLKKWMNGMPSDIDYRTMIYASLHYKEPVVECVISKYGLYFFWIQKKFLNFLLDIKDKDELEEIINEYTIPNIQNDNTKAMDAQDISLAQELTKKTFNTGDDTYGFDSKFIPIKKLK